jgi:PhzF family phenazine biosynthesis protein
VTSSRHSFVQLDVFTETALTGNPLAVVFEGDDLSDAQMSRLARWTNLSETTFVLRPTVPDADYRVRIFTSAAETDARDGLGNELPFAGHPTLGTCRAWLDSGGVPARAGVVVQECGAGLVEIRRRGDSLAFAAPALVRDGAVEDGLLERICSMLRLRRDDVVAASWVDNGPGWIGLLLRDAAAVLALEPGYVELDVGVIGPYEPGAPEAFEVRAFFPRRGSTAEDPVTGSLNASLAQWLLREGFAEAPYTASQGTALGRAGRVHVERDDAGTVWVGGGVVPVIAGTIDL